MPLVKCRDGGMSPAVLTCLHIADGTATEYVKVPSPEPGDEMDDYLCPTCLEAGPAGLLTADDLVTVCLHCIRDTVKTMVEVPFA